MSNSEPNDGIDRIASPDPLVLRTIIGSKRIIEMTADEYLAAVRAVEAVLGVKPVKIAKPKPPKRRKGRSPIRGRPFHKWTPEQIALLGKITDAKVAKIVGYSERTVWRYRTNLGIPSVQSHRLSRTWGQTELALIGNRTDEEAAEITQRPLADVAAKRKELAKSNGRARRK